MTYRCECCERPLAKARGEMCEDCMNAWANGPWGGYNQEGSSIGECPFKYRKPKERVSPSD